MEHSIRIKEKFKAQRTLKKRLRRDFLVIFIFIWILRRITDAVVRKRFSQHIGHKKDGKSYMESGHGKDPCNPIGGTAKRKVDMNKKP